MILNIVHSYRGPPRISVILHIYSQVSWLLFRFLPLMQNTCYAVVSYRTNLKVPLWDTLPVQDYLCTTLPQFNCVSQVTAGDLHKPSSTRPINLRYFFYILKTNLKYSVLCCGFYKQYTQEVIIWIVFFFYLFIYVFIIFYSLKVMSDYTDNTMCLIFSFGKGEGIGLALSSILP